MSAPHVTVVGGGITGLAAAWELLKGGAGVTVIEASSRLGGKIVTEEIGGRRVDLGPDSFLTRTPEAVQLCQELGLDDELVGSASESAYLWADGRLGPLPPRTVLGAPAGLPGLVAVARSGILSPGGTARAALDLVLPRRELGDDPSVGRIIRSRFGRQVHERLVDPVVGGIHAGSTMELSARATAPQLEAGARAHRSLLVGLSRLPSTISPGTTGGPAFVSLLGGMGRLVSELEQRLRNAGVRVELGRAATQDDLAGRATVILTTPAPVTAELVASLSPAASRELAEWSHASVALTVLRYPLTAFPGDRLPAGSGFLVPRRERRVMTACSFASAKWPHWAAPDEVVLRVSAGRWGDDRAEDLDDAQLVTCLRRELGVALGVRADPLTVRVARWPGAFPQYRPGHLTRVARVEAALARDCPDVHMAGAAFRGVGIPACIAQGRAAGRRALGL